ncbi:MAG: YeeE/YedE family protein [Spirosomataceae bacterium]
MIEFLKQPWHWSVAGVLIGLTVPTLLLLGNKTFGLSSNLRHICAAVIPANLDFFKYDWKKESWNLFFAGGILVGGFIGTHLLTNPNEIIVNEKTIADLKELGLTDFTGMLPSEIFDIANLFSLKGLIFFVFGGFLVGFGTRYANGCTSGHAIMGLSNLQLPSLIATITFMAGGILMTHFGLPLIFSLLK